MSGSEPRATMTAIGCLETLEFVREWRPRLVGKVSDWPLPQELHHSAMLVRELVLKAKGQWQFPYLETELCHCRGIPTYVVDQAVVCGAPTATVVSRVTSAGTACGTCKQDIESILEYRKQR